MWVKPGNRCDELRLFLVHSEHSEIAFVVIWCCLLVFLKLLGIPRLRLNLVRKELEESWWEGGGVMWVSLAPIHFLCTELSSRRGRPWAPWVREKEMQVDGFMGWPRWAHWHHLNGKDDMVLHCQPGPFMPLILGQRWFYFLPFPS